ncbi:MAG: T9SS type A sorting domain-containing protein [Bacteroidetes bacterium]|nr:T9SS type A sorting domain-containing protein [Bacteroidota bacterium]
MKSKFTALLLLVFLFSSLPLFAQLNTPTIAVSNITWGSFTLTLTNTSPGIQNTRWIIRETGGDTVMDTWWNQCDTSGSWISFPFTADQYDLTTKNIIGCKPGQQYTANALYNNGAVWSPSSNVINFTTGAEPALTGTDTIHVVLWGHSLLDYGDQCMLKSLIRCGNEDYNYADNIAHMLQTALRMSTGKKISVINRGVNGSQHSDWYNDYYNEYLAGGRYADHNSYPIVVFFFGANNAHNGYPVASFGNDMRNYISFLNNLGVKVVYNSIHHTKESFVDAGSQIAYRNMWNTVMNENSGNPKVRRGLDLYSLFSSNESRFLGADKVHPDLSEGMIEVARQLAPIVQSVTSVKKIEGFVPNMFELNQNFPNPFNPTTTIRYSIQKSAFVNLIVYDMNGKEVEKLVSENQGNGYYEVNFNADKLASGIYFYKLETQDFIATKKMSLLK